MATPQQPELRRSGDNALQPGGPDDVAAAPSKPDVGGDTGPVPDDNLPGHHPADEQDKPDPDDFVAKAREVAARAKAEGTTKKQPAKKQAAKRQTAAGQPAAGGPATSTPPSSAPVAAAGDASVAAADEADAPRATPDAVVADATLGTAAGSPTASPSPGTAPSPGTSAGPSPAPAGGATNPLLAVARFQWKLATLPIRTAIDLADKLRRRL